METTVLQIKRGPWLTTVPEPRFMRCDGVPQPCQILGAGATGAKVDRNSLYHPCKLFWKCKAVLK